MICQILDGLGQTYGCRPSEIVAGGMAEASFDLRVRMKAQEATDRGN